MTAQPAPQLFDLHLPTFTLEDGAALHRHIVRGWWWGPAADRPWLDARAVPVQAHSGYQVVHRTDAEVQALHAHMAQLRGANPLPPPDAPTVLVVHALTGDMRVGGDGGWWPGLLGEGRAIDPRHHRVLCFNNLGSCYGTSGPSDWAPRDGHTPQRQGILSTWDQARSILLALDALRIEKVDLLVGGSVGGAIALCLAALCPERFQKLVVIATAEASSPWVIGWNHIARSAIALDPTEGLKLARQIGHLTYRNESGLMQRHGRSVSLENIARFHADTSLDAAFRMQAYLEHQGERFIQRFQAESYLALLDTVDHHDLSRCPGRPSPGESWQGDCPDTPENKPELGDIDKTSPENSWGLARIRAEVFAAAVNSDELFFPVHSAALVDRLHALGQRAHYREISSIHGHDGFLMDIEQVAPIIAEALVS
ncbi:MAG: alpha/beta fold hydrolase [Proteobacteria bacterium]|nr:alpha/beta fold hydrolase [Pseudomonadota bacterium]